MTAKIAAFTFLEMIGEPLQPSLQVETLMRPGFAGQGYRLFAEQGKEYSVITTTELTDQTKAQDKIMQFKAIEGEDAPVTDNLGNQYLNVFVLKVERIGLQQIKTPCGALNANTVALLKCNWILQSVDV